MSAILVIEDNSDMRENIVEILELAGYEVVHASNGVLGIELAVLLKPDLIISDIAMPEMDGWEVLKAIRHHNHTEAIPFIMISAKADRNLERMTLQLGANAFLHKPFDAADLLHLTASCLGECSV